jgi:hypothetical protein
LNECLTDRFVFAYVEAGLAMIPDVRQIVGLGLVTCRLTRRNQSELPKQPLELFLILVSNSSYPRSRNTSPSSLDQAPFTTAHLLLTLTHPILLIKRPCSPFQTKTGFFQVRIQVKY